MRQESVCDEQLRMNCLRRDVFCVCIYKRCDSGRHSKNRMRS